MPVTTTPPEAEPTLRGRRVIVTGGSQGLGAAITEVLGADGARIVIADVVPERAAQQVARLAARGIEALAIRCDVGDEAQVEALYAQLRQRWGGVDVLVNNAGVDHTLPLDELEASKWEQVLRTNLTGPYLMARHAVRAMTTDAGGAAAGTTARGHIVNIASTASKRAWPHASAYHASKWGLLGLSHALHAELRSQGIAVSAVVAGGMRTPFLLDRFPDLDPGLLQEPVNVARAVRFVLLQPPGTVVPELMVLPTRETSWP